MIIIGINWEQNSSAALMIDGKIISAASEERFSNKKMMRAIQRELSIFYLSPIKLKRVK